MVKLATELLLKEILSTGSYMDFPRFNQCGACSKIIQRNQLKVKRLSETHFSNKMHSRMHLIEASNEIWLLQCPECHTMINTFHALNLEDVLANFHFKGVCCMKEQPLILSKTQDIDDEIRLYMSCVSCNVKSYYGFPITFLAKECISCHNSYAKPLSDKFDAHSFHRGMFGMYGVTITCAHCGNSKFYLQSKGEYVANVPKLYQREKSSESVCQPDLFSASIKQKLDRKLWSTIELT